MRQTAHVDLDGLRRRDDDPGAEVSDLVKVGVPHENQNLVSAEAADRACRPHCLPQALADGLQKRVARSIPQPVVHLFEAVEIEIE
nr:hypothetical protein [Aureimonas sp. AU40]